MHQGREVLTLLLRLLSETKFIVSPNIRNSYNNYFYSLVITKINIIILEIRDSQNLAKLGLGGKPSLHVL